MSKVVRRYKSRYKPRYKSGKVEKTSENKVFASLSFRPVTDERTESGAVATPLFQPERLEKRPVRVPSGQVATAPQNHVHKSVRHGFFINNSGTV